MKGTWGKIIEYASSPLHGSLSRSLRKGVRVQVNEGKIYESAPLFLGEEFVRFTENIGGEAINTYFDWGKIESVRTYGLKEKS